MNREKECSGQGYSRLATRTSLADGIAVREVQTLVNGWLTTSDRQAPYVCDWFVRSRPEPEIGSE